MTVYFKRVINNRKGFTLIELMVVLVILGLLVGIFAPKIIGRTDEAKVTKTKVQIRNIESALKLYKLDNGVYPTTEQGLDALISKPTIGEIPTEWREGGYLEGTKIPDDPWGNPYFYLSPGTDDRDYDLFSTGADGIIGGEGINADIKSWELQ